MKGGVMFPRYRDPRWPNLIAHPAKLPRIVRGPTKNITYEIGNKQVSNIDGGLIYMTHDGQHVYYATSDKDLKVWYIDNQEVFRSKINIDINSFQIFQRTMEQSHL